MGINVNTVYTTVLSILNKEQRGYLTPYEFNNLATQVQLEIFENFFEDYNQFTRMPKTDVEFASRLDHISEEIQFFEKQEKAYAVSGNVYTQPVDLHRFGSAFWQLGKNNPEIELVSAREYSQQTLSPILNPSNDFPIAKYIEDQLHVYPVSTNSVVKDVEFSYIRKPKDVKWGFSIGSLGQYIYDSTVFIATGFPTESNYLLNSLTTNYTASGAAAGPLTLDQSNAAVTYTNATGGAGTGTGMIFQLTLDSSGLISNLTVTAPGKDYVVGDIFTLSDSLQTVAGGTNAVITVGDNTLYSGSTYGSTNFEISDSQQTECILKILQYSGVVIRDPSIVQAAAQELAQDNANEKR